MGRRSTVVQVTIAIFVVLGSLTGSPNAAAKDDGSTGTAVTPTVGMGVSSPGSSHDGGGGGALLGGGGLPSIESTLAVCPASVATGVNVGDPKWAPCRQPGQAPAAGGGVPVVDPGFALAVSLRAQLSITMPDLHTAPPPGTPSIVGFPTWLWVDAQAARPVTKTATAGPLVVSITATPQGVDWDSGDGQTIHCDGPGTPFVAGVTDPKVTAPSCSHVYTQRSTVTDPNGTFVLRGSMTWTVQWGASTGQSGTLDPLTVTRTIPIQVKDLQPVLD